MSIVRENMASYKYSVLLKSGLPPREKELLNIFCFKLVSQSKGEDLLYFRCTQIDVSHHSYIEMEILHPDDLTLSVLRVPHHWVFLIRGSEDKPSIGF